MILAVFAVAGSLVAGAVRFLFRGRAGPPSSERLADLEARVARLESAVDLGATDDGDDD